MDTLKYISFLLLSFILCSCSFDKYQVNEDSFNTIMITNWTNKKDSLKVELSKYKKGSNFKINESKNSNFKIENNKALKILYLTPNFKNTGAINSDMTLIINDSILYKFTDVQSVRDTTHKSFGISKHYTIFYKTFAKVNSARIEDKGPFIVLDSKLAIKIKKKE